MNLRAPHFVLFSSLVSLACDQSVPVNPAPVAHQNDDAGIDASDPMVPDVSDPLLPTEAGPLRRSVMKRSPFGNLAHTDNLLLDGDMEMSAGTSQTPWIALGISGQARLRLETGGRCRSGLRCLLLNSSVKSVYGQGIAAKNKALEFWMWAKVPGSSCNTVTVYLFSAMTMNITSFNVVQSETKEPDDSGWCRFHTFRNPMDESVGVYVEANLLPSEQVLLDDAVLRPADGVSPTQVRSSLPISKADHARIVAQLGPILRERWIGPPPPEGLPPIMGRTGKDLPSGTPPRTFPSPPVSR